MPDSGNDGYWPIPGVALTGGIERLGLHVGAVLAAFAREWGAWATLSSVRTIARTVLSQVWEVLLIGGLDACKKEGPKYLQRFLSRQKKEGLSE